ncbi:MAG: S-layer homology domain-containing protein [Clostridiales bacterium]|jgi:hypothetical protein|nr:S-layer homology domain-containing protein [Clostridiales bacterium]
MTADDRFREAERMRLRTLSNEASALRHAAEVERKKWQISQYLQGRERGCASRAVPLARRAHRGGADGTGRIGETGGGGGIGSGGTGGTGSGAGNSGETGAGGGIGASGISGNSASPFSDVAEGAYYAGAARWAAANGIGSGAGGGLFEPDAAITRQDLAALLSRYADHAGIALPASRPPAEFADGAGIADYAKEAVGRLYGAGVINGKPGGLFDPVAGATRAEAAAMLHRFLESAS